MSAGGRPAGAAGPQFYAQTSPVSPPMHPGGTIRGMEPVVLLLIVGVIAAVVFGSVTSRQAMNHSWDRVATRLGVSLTPGAWNKSPQLAGSVSGYPLSVDIKKRDKTAFTRFRLGVPDLPAGLKLKSEGFISGISKVFGGQDIEVGDAAFDDRVLVKGTNAEAVRAFLTPPRRREIRRFLDTHSGSVIDGDGISWSRRGRVRDSARLLETIEAMLGLARVLAGDEETDAAIAGAAAAAGVATAMAASPAATPAADYTSSDPDIAGVEMASIPEPARQPSEAAEIDDVPEMAEAGPEPMEATSTQGDVAEPDDAAAFCDALFAPGAMSFETTRTFDAEFKGSQVDWSGTLKSVEPYRYDFVFGSGPAVKATLTLREAEGKAHGADVRAVISLPAEIEGLDRRIGERIGFSGTLSKVDGFTRNVFLTDGRLR